MQTNKLMSIPIGTSRNLRFPIIINLPRSYSESAFHFCRYYQSTSPLGNHKMTTTLKSSIGEFKGIKGDGVTQYLGIKYANLKDQLAVPELVKHYSSDIVDATKFG